MTTVAYANALGQLRGEPKKLVGSKRRRLSAVMAQNSPPPGQRFIVSVHRRGETVLRPNDRNVRLRAHWRKSLVGPNDVVLVTVMPGKGGVASIGLAIASVALLIVAPYAAPAIAAGIAGGVASAGAVAAVQAGLVIGGIALGYAAQASAAAKKKTDKSIYSVSGGGNVPKPGARKPLLYGRSWSAPPLSQKDFITYDGDTMVLTKRLTLGIGRFQVHKVQVGESNFWLENGGIQAPFTSTAGPLGTTIEFLYQQPSTVAPGDAISSPSVGGQEVPRPDGNPSWTPWFRATPQGVVADAVQVSHSYPAIYRTSSQGRQVPAAAGVIYQQREIHPDTGEVIGPEVTLWNADEGVTALTNTPLRRSGYLRFPKRGAYQVRAQNKWPDAVGFDQKNAASWDDMTAFKDDVRVRNNTTEIVMRIRAGKGMSITSFSDIWVEATRIIPVWNGSGWVEQPERKAIWSFADLVRSNYGLNLPNNFDVDRAEHYHNVLTANDTFDGLLPEVSPFWEAASEILLPLRADPIKIGPVHSFTRDESRNEPRHVISRRQIVQGSSSATYKTKVEGSDVIVEFNRDGDPRRPDEARYSYGPPSRTPKRYKVNGIRDGLHAQKHATWLAAVAVFRGAERRITTEWTGRLVTPGDHVLSDVWYLKGQQVFGVDSAQGNTLTLDCDANVSPEWGYGSIRKRDGREWGIIRMRGVGVRGLELNAVDLTLLQNQTGLSLANALAKDTQDPTTVVLGELVELQKTFVARAAVPVNADQVQIEMVRDDPRVWQLIDEQVLGPLPVGEDTMAEPLVPQLRVLHARCQRVETGIVAVWGVTPVPGARTYEADISYDQGQSWEDLSPQSGASTGQAPMRQSNPPVTVRARAFGRTGLPGAYIVTTFLTVAPIVQGSLVDVSTIPPIPYNKLAEEARAIIEAAQAKADEAQAKAISLTDNIRRALAADPSERQGYVDGMMGDVQKSISFLADVATRLLNEVNLLKDRQAAAGIEVLPDQGIVRIAGLARLETEVGTRLTSLSVTVDALQGLIESYGAVQTGDLSGLITEINTVKQTLNAATATISTLATSAQFNEVSATLGSVQTTLDAQDAAIEQRATKTTVDQLTTRTTTVEQGLFAAEGRIRTAITAAGTSAADGAMIPRLLSQLGDLLQGQIGAISQNIARVETNQSANIDEQGRVTAEVSSRLIAFQGESTAQFATVTKAVADTNDAMVRSQTLLLASIGEVSAGLTREEEVRASEVAAQTTRVDGALSRIGTAEGRITGLDETFAGEKEATARRFSDVGSRFNEAEGRITSLADTQNNDREATSRSFEAVSARFDESNANIRSVTEAQSSASQSQSEVNTQLYARTDAGTAEGRIRFGAVSAPGDVAARFSIQLSTERNFAGSFSASGFFMDILTNGQTRTLLDANLIAFTANGGTTYPFRFTGTETYIDTLRLGPGNFLPNSISQSNADFNSNSHTISFKVNVRPGSAVLIFAEFYGQPDQPLAVGQQGLLRIARDGVALRDKGMNYYTTRAASGNTVQTLGTEAFYRDVPPPGEHTYTIAATNGQNGVAYTFFEITGS